MQVCFLISGLVIDAATQGKTQPGPDVFLFTCTSNAKYSGDQELFMSTRVGDTILALDAPFKLTFGEGKSEGCKVEADGCIQAVYGFRYEIDDDQGIVLKQSGINMLQHLTSRWHQNQLHICSGLMTPHIAQFSAQVAVNHSLSVGEPSSSSNSSSAANMIEPPLDIFS